MKIKNLFSKLPLWGKIALIAFLMVVVIALGLLGCIHSKLNKIKKIDNTAVVTISPENEVFETDVIIDETSEIKNTMDPEDIVWGSADIDVMSDDDIKNILFVGHDARPGETKSRADSIIICSVNKKTDEITLVSLMRDMYLPIPGYSDNRINAAFQFGGFELLDKTIEEDFGIHIDGNVIVDFQSFIEAMSVVGNLDIELTKAEANYLNENDVHFAEDAGYEPQEWDLKEGMNSLTPEQCLAYARIRYVGNADYERTERQRVVLKTAFAKMDDLSITDLINAADEIFPCLSTDMTNNEMLGFIYTVVTNGMEITNDYRIPVDHSYTSETIRGMSVLVPSLKTNSAELQKFLYGEE